MTKAAQMQFKLANIWQAKGQLDRAMTSYQNIIDAHPPFVPAYVELGRLLMQQNRLADTVSLYQQAVAQRPDDPGLRQTLTNLVTEQTAETAAGQQSTFQPITDRGRGHILLYTDCGGINGVEQCNHSLMLHLVQAGYWVTCAQPWAAHYLIEEREQAGVRHLWLRDDVDVYDVSRPRPSLTDAAEPRQIIGAAQPDLIIFADGCPVSSLAAKQAAVELNIPFVAIVHCVTEAWANFFAPWLPALAEMYQQAQAIVSVSQANLALLHRLFGLPQTKGQVIYNGRPSCYFKPISPATRQQLRAKFQIPVEAVALLTVARMETVKGYQYLLKAMQQLQQQPEWSQLCFVWVGAGTMESQLRAQVAQLEATGQVKFLGQRPDIPDMLTAADIFVLPSQFEGMPLSIMEAMAAGLPVIASAVSGIPEELADTGHLLPDPNIAPQAAIDQLVTTISHWATDAGLRRAVGRACKARAKELFKADKMLANYLQLIEEINVTATA